MDNSELEVELLSGSELSDYSFGGDLLHCVTLCGKFLQMFREIIERWVVLGCVRTQYLALRTEMGLRPS